MQMVLDAILRRLVTRGSLTVRWPDGGIRIYGDAPNRASTGPRAGMHLTCGRAVRRLVTNPSLTLGEEYMDGGVVPLDCSIFDLLELLVLNVGGSREGHPVARLRYALGQ